MFTDDRKANNVTLQSRTRFPYREWTTVLIVLETPSTRFDLLKGFWQIPLTKGAKEISEIVTPNLLCQYKVMPFAMKNSSATFQHLINRIIMDLKCRDTYMDSLITASESLEEHIRIIRELFERLSKAKLTIHLPKNKFGCAAVTYSWVTKLDKAMLPCKLPSANI